MKSIKISLTAILLLVAVCEVFGTAQISDKLIYKDKEYSLQATPLESFFDKNPSLKPTGITMTALWRGYRATFEIRDKALFVTDIEFIRSPEEGFTSALESVFPAGPTKAQWHTGILVLPYGEVTGYEKERFAATYSNYMVIEVKEGDVNRIKRFTTKSYNKFMDSQFRKFRNSPQYGTATEKVLTRFPDADSDFIELYIRQNLTDYIPGIF